MVTFYYQCSAALIQQYHFWNHIGQTHSPLYSLFSIKPLDGLSGNWGLEQYQTPGCFPPSVWSLHPLFILSTWQPARQHCAIGLHSRHSQALVFLFSSFHLRICLFVLYPLFILLFPIHCLFPLSLSLLSPPPPSEKTAASVRCLKIEAAEKQKVMDTWRHSSGNLPELQTDGGKEGERFFIEG